MSALDQNHDYTREKLQFQWQRMNQFCDTEHLCKLLEWFVINYMVRIKMTGRWKTKVSDFVLISFHSTTWKERNHSQRESKWNANKSDGWRFICARVVWRFEWGVLRQIFIVRPKRIRTSKQRAQKIIFGILNSVQ